MAQCTATVQYLGRWMYCEKIRTISIYGNVVGQVSSFISIGRNVRCDYASLTKRVSVQYLVNITPTSFCCSVRAQVLTVFRLVFEYRWLDTLRSLVFPFSFQ